MIRSKLQLKRSSVSECLIWSLFEVSLMWIADIVVGADAVRCRVISVSREECAIDVVYYQETVVVIR